MNVYMVYSEPMYSQEGEVLVHGLFSTLPLADGWIETNGYGKVREIMVDAELAGIAHDVFEAAIQHPDEGEFDEGEDADAEEHAWGLDADAEEHAWGLASVSDLNIPRFTGFDGCGRLR